MRVLAILSTLAATLAGTAFGASVPDLTSAVHGRRLEISPPAGHHFNVKAPAKASEGSKTLRFDLKAKQLAVSLPASATERDVSVEAFVCDDALTFCLKKAQVFHVPAVSGAQAEAVRAQAPSVGHAARAHVDAETGFYVNDPDRAFKLARQKKLPLMIDFFGIWCPPCNHLDAMVFRSAKFKARNARRFVHLKLDADQEKFNPLLKDRYHIQVLPTVVFTTAAGDEIFRLVGFHPLEEMMAKADAAYSSRDDGYAALAWQASTGDLEARYRAAKIAIDRDEPEKALAWLSPLKKMLAQAHDPRLADVYRAQLGTAYVKKDKAQQRQALEAWLMDFPDSIDSVENGQALADLEADEGHADASHAALARAVALTEKLIASPGRALEGSYFTPADLTESRADLYDRLGDRTRAQSAYLACAEAYAKEANDEGKGFARGPNLERAYCLGKAGRIEESKAIYLEGIRRFPREYTFHQGLAKLWLDSAKDARRALPEAEKALHYAYGNQHLKAMWTQVRALEMLGDVNGAIRAIDGELGVPESEGAIQSTVKLREKLRSKREELAKKSAAPT
jgi:thiol-disulfide isomerase/thioredoxin